MAFGCRGQPRSERSPPAMHPDPKKAPPNTTRLLTSLVTDPAFLRVQRLGQQANLFSILGRTYTETWHSMLLGWLLDPQGSHGFGDYGLHLLSGAVAGVGYSTQEQSELWANLAAFGNFRSTVVTPNERSPHETAFKDGSRADVNVDHVHLEGSGRSLRRFKLIVEQKVLARPAQAQLERYQELCSRIADVTCLGVLVAPTELLGPVAEYVQGSACWSALDFQALHDHVLVPLQEHPDIDDRARLIIGDYITCLRSWKRGIAPVITDRERQLAIDIYERHSEAFKIIKQALVDHDPPAEMPDGREEEDDSPLLILIDGSEISGPTVPAFMQSALQHFDESGSLDSASSEGKLPYPADLKRYLVNSRAEHPDGMEFRRPVSAGKWFLDAHASRASAILKVGKLARHLGHVATEPD
jgi:PD-(D/E)XK nuclease superfamily protein